MNRFWKVFFAFLAFDLFVVWRHGYFSLFPPFKDLVTTQIFLDLSISLWLVSFAMADVWRKRGGTKRELMLWFGGIVLFGSLAPLLFMALYYRRER